MQEWTVNKLIAWAIDFFRSKGIQEPRLSAELLLASVLGLSRIQLYMNHDYRLQETELQTFKRLILQRLEHRPIQYILNTAYFRKIRLYVDENVLIPRSETELLVDKTLDVIRSMSQKTGEVHVLEVGIGSGAVSLSILKEIEDKSAVRIAGTDISEKVLSVCEKNITENIPQEHRERISLQVADVMPQGSLFGDDKDDRIDVLVSNPPYIRQEDYPHLPKQVREYEPKSALVAGITGSEMYGHIIDKTFPKLSKDGAFILFETDPLTSDGASKAVLERYREAEVDILPDYNGRHRILMAKIGRF